MSLEQFVATYGYLAIGVGTFLEGETILVIGGFLAHRGYLDLLGVIAAAFAGSYCGDQLYYYIGHVKGMHWLERHPRWRAASQRALSLLRLHQVPLILGFRFLYGLRNVTPFLIGASGIRPLRYAVLNATGAVIWAAAVGMTGYLVGQTFELLLEEIKKYEILVLTAIAAVGALVWLLRRVKGE